MSRVDGLGSEQALAPELIWVGGGAWVARDPSVPDNDARRVVAYLELKDDQVCVLWVRDRHDACCYETLGEALREVALACGPEPAPTRVRDREKQEYPLRGI